MRPCHAILQAMANTEIERYTGFEIAKINVQIYL